MLPIRCVFGDYTWRKVLIELKTIIHIPTYMNGAVGKGARAGSSSNPVSTTYYICFYFFAIPCNPVSWKFDTETYLKVKGNE